MDIMTILTYALIAYVVIGLIVFVVSYFFMRDSFGESVANGFFWLPLAIIRIIGEGIDF